MVHWNAIKELRNVTLGFFNNNSFSKPKLSTHCYKVSNVRSCKFAALWPKSKPPPQ